MQANGRVLGLVVTPLLAFALLASGLGVYTVRRPYPRVNGTVVVPGLRGVVEIYRDNYGIPHIYADDAHDLFLAQGYVHAQDRFYQMDFWRHQTAGRLSELYGSGAVSTDKFLRTVGWLRVAEQEYSLADAETKAALDAYAAGVNAYLGGRSAADLGLEYSILGLIGLKDYRPDPWTPANSLAWAKAMAWNLGGESGIRAEVRRAILMSTLGPEKTQDYLPAYPGDHPIIVPHPAVAALDAGVLRGLEAQLDAVAAVLGGSFEGIGSNNWVIAGSRTTTGMPLLANDPHLGIQMPSIWYEIGLHCRRLTPDCPYDVVGFSLAGDPGVILGHNRRIAWGATNLAPDVVDLYVEKINPANPNQYEVNGQWVDMTVLQETIKIRGGAEETVTIRYTRHGPILSEVFGLLGEIPPAGLDPAYPYAIAARWTALEPTFIFRAVLQLNRARNWDEFRAALREWSVPSQNLVYADVDGNIGYQAPGNIPIRRNGEGLLPVPGWTDDHEWTGYIPFDELPYAFNPPEGYIVTANNAVVDETYPYFISRGWDVGYRARRIVEMIEAQPKISIEYVQQMQGDDMNLGAREVLPYLLALRFDDPALAAAAERLRGWDFQMRMDSRPAAIYLSFFNALLAETFHDELPERYWPGGGSSNWATLRQLLAEPGNGWWDNVTTPQVETRDDILRRAFAAGYSALEQELGADPNNWTWGRLHTSTFENATLGSEASPGPIRALFNRGPFPTAGGESIVNAADWSLAADDRDPPGDPYAVGSLPSMRMIVDLGDLDNSLAMHTTGQSGHAFHRHYADMIDPWRFVQYHPMLWSRDRVEAQAEALLTLRP